MKRLLVLIKNRVFIALLGLAALSLLIWFLGPHIKFGEANHAPLGSETARLLAIMALMVLWGLNNLRLAAQSKRHNAGLIADLQESSSPAQDPVGAQRSEEVEVIGERFAQALATLKQLRFSGGTSRKALYELPWYVIIGPPGSGKTTALVNSGLEFPLAEKLGMEALQGVGGTRHCDWWFTNEAVLIDTAGRYTTQDSHKVVDGGAWDGFLALLRKHRRRRPLNGVIVAISLQELLLQSEEERLAHARTIRARVDELMTKLEIRFPIYLVFTKTDLVAGFAEFFDNLSREERDQVWGISLPDAPGPDQGPDFDALAARYDALGERLYQRLLHRVHDERDINRRAAINAFPQQMGALRDTALQFVYRAFAPNRYRYQPYLRGVYFTSGTQDGTPVDRLMSSVAANFGFDRQAMATGQGGGKSYFLRRLFREVIFPEAELVGTNRRYEALMRWSQRGAYGALATAAAATLLIWTASYARHEGHMGEVQDFLAQHHAERAKLAAGDRDLRAVLPSLGALAQASAVYSQEARPWLVGLGMYDGSLDRAARAAYEAQLAELLLPRLLHYLEDQLASNRRDGDLYDNLRTYLMFSRLEHLDRAHVQTWFADHLARDWEADPTARAELMRHLQRLMSLDLPASAPNQPLVASARAQLRQVPLSQRIYSRIRSDAAYADRVDLLHAFGDSVRSTYVLDGAARQYLSLPALFTKRAYDGLDLSPSSPVISTLARDNWVLSDEADARAVLTGRELADVARRVQDHYYAEYLEHWNRLYRALEVQPFQNLRHANEMLQLMADPVHSPLVAILRVGAANTTLSSQLLANMADDHQGGVAGQALAMASERAPLTVVDRQFRELNLLLRETKDHPPQTQAILRHVRQLQEFVNEISAAADPHKRAFDVAAARYQGGGGNAATALHQYANSLPEPINRWLRTLSSETWRIVLIASRNHINAEWQTQVHEVCARALADRYPFHPGSGTDAAMADFTQFFKPGGTIDSFAAEYVRPFVDTRRGWSNRSIDNYNLGLSEAGLRQIQQANRIRSVFFAENPAVPSFTFQLRPVELDKNNTRFTLEVGGNRLNYSHGPKFWSTLQWAGSAEYSRVRIVFEDIHERHHSLSYEGPWAWFRLQDSAEPSAIGAGDGYTVTYRATDGHHRAVGAPAPRGRHNVRYEIRASSVNNPFSRDLLGGFTCAARL